jgi:hypothetical protein
MPTVKSNSNNFFSILKDCLSEQEVIEPDKERLPVLQLDFTCEIK